MEILFLLLLLRVVAVAVRQGFSVLTALDVLELCLYFRLATNSEIHECCDKRYAPLHLADRNFYPMTTYPYHPSKCDYTHTLKSLKAGLQQPQLIEQRRT